MYALCYACGSYIPMDQVGSHNEKCSATEEEISKVSFVFWFFYFR